MSDEKLSDNEQVKRTPAEIIARMQSDSDDDFFGFRAEVLLAALSYEDAHPFLKKDVTQEQWVRRYHISDVVSEARNYLRFAVEKIIDHRGLSASRSVQKLEEYAWLMGRDDIIDAMRAAEYPQYGAPKIKAFADGMKWDWTGDASPLSITWLERMAVGESCHAECRIGCNS